MTSFPHNDYFFPLMTRETFACLILDIVDWPYLLNVGPGAWPVLENGPSTMLAWAALQKKKWEKIGRLSFSLFHHNAYEDQHWFSKRYLAKATANELEEYKKWLSKQFLWCTTLLAARLEIWKVAQVPTRRNLTVARSKWW